MNPHNNIFFIVSITVKCNCFCPCPSILGHRIDDVFKIPRQLTVPSVGF
jgi:hypothetical protein